MVVRERTITFFHKNRGTHGIRGHETANPESAELIVATAIDSAYKGFQFYMNQCSDVKQSW